MAHSVEVLLDDDSDASIRREWQALAEAGLPSQLQVKSVTNRPHVTLLAADHISPDVDGLLAELRGWFPVPCVVGAPLVFGRGRLTLARLIVPSAQLLALHQEVYGRCLPYVSASPSRTARRATGPRMSRWADGSRPSRRARRSVCSTESPTTLTLRWSGCGAGTVTSGSMRC